MIETKIYVGLSDADLHEQKFDTSRYIEVLRSICKNYGVAFSFSEIGGGYFHEDGTYVDENSLVLSLIDAPQDTIDEISEDLCVFFHQESVMVTQGEVEMRFLRKTVTGRFSRATQRPKPQQNRLNSQVNM